MIETIDSPYIHGANSENFEALVLENSNLGPVLVNFWSKKAGPCLRQYPILDKLIWNYTGRLMLVNINTETEFIVTKEYGITSVPTLKLFRNASVVETMHGYQSEQVLKKLLARYITRDSDHTIAKAVQLYSDAHSEHAYELLAEAITQDPENPRLPLAMCKMLNHEKRYEDAMKILQSLPEDIGKDPEIVQFSDLLWFYSAMDTEQDVQRFISRVEQDKNDLHARKQIVIHSVFHQNHKQALEELVCIMNEDKEFNNNYAQIAMLKLFNVIGKDNPLVSQFRSNLKRYTH